MKRDKLRLEPTADPSTLIIRWEGQLIMGNRNELKGLVWDIDKNVIVDLIQTGYVDSSGLGILLTISRRLRLKGKRLAIVGINDDLSTLFELTKMDQFLDVAFDERAALAMFAAAPPVPVTIDEQKARKKYNPTDLLTFQEVVEWWGVSSRTLERMSIPWSYPTSVKGGRLRRVMFKDLLAHYEKRKAG